MIKANTNKERNLIKIFSTRLSAAGTIVGALFFALSLSPSMLPRGFVMQGVVSGLSVIFGYAAAVAGSWLWQFLELPVPKNKLKRYILSIFAGAVVLIVCYAIWQFVRWQNSVRNVFGAEHINLTFILPTLIIAVLLSLGLLIIGRSIKKLYQYIYWRINKRLPHRLSLVLGAIVVFLLLNFIYSGILGRSFFVVTNRIFSAADVRIDPKLVKPTSALKSGSSQSLVSWESLGRQGRKFVATGSSATDINELSGGGAKEPIRAYAGLSSAQTLDDRADLLLKELIRTGAFERHSLLIVSTTGTGWIDPKSVEPFEYINNGDTAVAGVQYSYLPSWISLLADQQNAKDTSRVVFSKIYSHWSQLPANSRPNLYLYGLSLGSYGAETVLNSVELVNEPISGALLAGPPFVNDFQNSLENARDVGSPAWQPIINNGTTVRFTGNENALTKPTGKWGDTKIIYLQHATDPVVWFSPDLLLSKPDWLKAGQRGPGITKDFRWVPIVTMWQMAADVAAGGSVPDGFGHNYSVLSNLDAWVALTNPPDWSQTKADAYKEYFSKAQY